MNSKKEFEKLTTPEKFEAVRFLKVFIVRHGLTEYKERESVKKFGKWNPDIHDITPEGEDELRDTALRIIQEINPNLSYYMEDVYFLPLYQRTAEKTHILF